jgi:hypothetical protein
MKNAALGPRKEIALRNLGEQLRLMGLKRQETNPTSVLLCVPPTF